MSIVSIGLPVYNGEKYLAETLDSLLAQTFADFEIVIADNASTDRTAAICAAYQTKDRRVRYVRNDRNIGAAANFNRTFELARAPLFHGGSCDDLYEPRFLEACVDALRRDTGAALAYTVTRLIDDEGQPLRLDRQRNCYVGRDGEAVMTQPPPDICEAVSPARRFRDVLWRMGWCLPLSGLVRREALRRTSLYADYFGADKVLLAELALQGRFHRVGEELFAKRIHATCTLYKSTRERADHEAGGVRGIPQLRMLRDYTRMVLAADLSGAQRLHCLVTIIGIARRPEVWRRLLVPGPQNYFGLSFDRS